MTVKHFYDLEQGSDEWLEVRRGILTASELKNIITPSTMKAASNDKERSYLYEIVAQSISGFVEPHYISDDMLRGHVDEVEARVLYSKHYSDAGHCGFITNDKWGFTLGYSPDGLVGDDGLVECKSRRQKYQIETIVKREVPIEHIIQCQTGLLISERKWLDYVSYCGGLPMFVLRVFPDQKAHDAIIEASAAFYRRAQEMIGTYHKTIDEMKLVPTERKIVSDEINF